MNMKLLRQLNEAGQKKYSIMVIDKKTKKTVDEVMFDKSTYAVQNVVYGLTNLNKIVKKMKDEGKFDFKNFNYEVQDEDGYFIKKVK